MLYLSNAVMRSSPRHDIPFGIRGRVAIVTGGSKGVGQGIAQALGAAGARVVVVSRHIVEANRVAGQIIRSGGDALAFAGDISHEPDMHEMAAFVMRRFGEIDILCANAGIDGLMSLDAMTISYWDMFHNINVKGTFLSIRAVLPHIKRSSSGRIIIISSILGNNVGLQTKTAYSSTKAAQVGMMRSAALELAPYNITVNAVLAGSIWTRPRPAQNLDRIRVPLGRYGAPEDVGWLCAFLASSEAAWITGQSITIDGGISVRWV